MRNKRLRDWGIRLGYLLPGPHNAITDVKGVAVGHCTVVEGDAIRTGVTAVFPHLGNLWQHKVPAAVEVINGFGKAVGLPQICELGEVETPILLTNTLSVGTVLDALVEYKLERNPQIGRKEPTVNGVVAECNDGYLNDIRRRAIGRPHVKTALAAATTGFPGEGNIGAGTGMSSFGVKGGIGTSSRLAGDYICGVLVLSNFGRWRQLKVAGVPVGRLLPPPGGEEPDKGSIVIIIATDAPLDARQMGRLARRAGMGLARTGSVASHGSGDFVLAFTTWMEGQSLKGEKHILSRLRDEKLSSLFEAVVEATEEAILNALFAAREMVGRDGHRRPALPVPEILAVIRQYQPVEEKTID